MTITDDEARILDICRTNKLEAVHLERLIAGYEDQLRKLQRFRETMLDQDAKLARVEVALREAADRLHAEDQMRPSLEVLQRMANGLDPFDRGRFQCAVAALPHETPKLTATVSHSTNKIHWGPIDPLDPDRIARGHEKTQKHLQERLEASGLQVIEGEGREA